MKPFFKLSYSFLLFSILMFIINCKEKPMKKDIINMSEETTKSVHIERADYGVIHTFK